MPDPDPIIIDDGGSTRIKQLTRNVNMDGLISQHSDFAAGNFEDTATRTAKCDVTIVHINRQGSHNNTAVVRMKADDIIEIASKNGQRASVELQSTGLMQLSVGKQSATDPEPIVDARHGDDIRRYVVINAGNITKVTHVRGATRTDKFTSTPDTVYTLVHFGL